MLDRRLDFGNVGIDAPLRSKGYEDYQPGQRNEERIGRKCTDKPAHANS